MPPAFLVRCSPSALDIAPPLAGMWAFFTEHMVDALAGTCQLWCQQAMAERMYIVKRRHVPYIIYLICWMPASCLKSDVGDTGFQLCFSWDVLLGR